MMQIKCSQEAIVLFLQILEIARKSNLVEDIDSLLNLKAKLTQLEMAPEDFVALVINLDLLLSKPESREKLSASKINLQDAVSCLKLCVNENALLNQAYFNQFIDDVLILSNDFLLNCKTANLSEAKEVCMIEKGIELQEEVRKLWSIHEEWPVYNYGQRNLALMLPKFLICIRSRTKELYQQIAEIPVGRPTLYIHLDQLSQKLMDVEKIFVSYFMFLYEDMKKERFLNNSTSTEFWEELIATLAYRTEGESFLSILETVESTVKESMAYLARNLVEKDHLANEISVLFARIQSITETPSLKNEEPIPVQLSACLTKLGSPICQPDAFIKGIYMIPVKA